MRGLAFLLAMALVHPEDWLAKASVDLSRIQSLDATVNRVTTQDRASLKESWRIRLRAPDSFRIDLVSPTRRVVVATDSVVEYLPEAHEAMRTHFESTASRQAFFQKILSRVSITGSRFGSPEELLRRFRFEVTAQERGARLVGTPRSAQDGVLILEPVDLATGDAPTPSSFA